MDAPKIITITLDDEEHEDLLDGRKLGAYIRDRISNSEFLSSDILTEFRGRGDEVKIYPLCFAEFVSAFDGTVQEAWSEYFTYGGMPLILTRRTEELKSKYLMDLFRKV